MTDVTFFGIIDTNTAEVESRVYIYRPQLPSLPITQAVEVSGRVLPPPILLASHRVVPERGRWQLGQGVGLYKPATLHTWSLVQYDVQGLKRNTLHEYVVRVFQIS